MDVRKLTTGDYDTVEELIEDYEHNNGPCSAVIHQAGRVITHQYQQIIKLRELLTPIAEAKVYNPSRSTRPDTFRTINVKFKHLDAIKREFVQGTDPQPSHGVILEDLVMHFVRDHNDLIPEEYWPIIDKLLED